MFGRDPKDYENIEGLAKAAAVLNMVFGLKPPPEKLKPTECELIYQSARLMDKEDPSIRFGLVMSLHAILSQNPQCGECWKRMGEMDRD